MKIRRQWNDQERVEYQSKVKENNDLKVETEITEYWKKKKKRKTVEKAERNCDKMRKILTDMTFSISPPLLSFSVSPPSLILTLGN